MTKPIFIKLQLQDETHVWVNAAFIADMKSNANGYTGISQHGYDGNNTAFNVSETPEQIVKMIDEATQPAPVPSMYTGPVMLEKEMD